MPRVRATTARKGKLDDQSGDFYRKLGSSTAIT